MRMDTEPHAAASDVLFAWFSPAFPTGAFAYSHGLETAAAEGLVTDEADLGEWLADVLALGAGWTDAVLMSLAYCADAAELARLAELGTALSPSRERAAETLGQGGAFAAAIREGWPELSPPPVMLGRAPYPVAAGWAAGALGADLRRALGAYLTGFTANLIAAGVRLSLCGQAGGVRILARLGPTIAALGARAVHAEEDDLGGCALWSDIASLRHEPIDGRLFLS